MSTIKVENGLTPVMIWVHLLLHNTSIAAGVDDNGNVDEVLSTTGTWTIVMSPDKRLK